MRFYAPKECEEWCRFQQVPLNQRVEPTHTLTQPHQLRCEFPSSLTQLLWFSRCIESALQPRDHCLLWITGTGIFPSSENYHLYYRFRQSYGDQRLLHEAPGHLCLDYEVPEVVTLMQMCMLFSWDVHVIPTMGYARAFVCHDEWLSIGFDSEQELNKTWQELEQAGLDVSSGNAI